MMDGVDGDILKSHASSLAGWCCLSRGLGEGTAGGRGLREGERERDGEIDTEGRRVRGQERGQTDGFGSS